MPASLQNLYTQSRSLQAYTQALQVTGQNIASSADPNYTRQQVTLQSALPGSEADVFGSSVTAVIKDTRDQLIESQIWREQSGLNYQTERLSQAEQLELLLFSGGNGPIGVTAESGEYLNDGLNRTLQEFFSAWADLEVEPNNSTVKQSIFNQAQAIVDRFNADAQNMAELRESVSDGLRNSVAEVNRLVAGVATLQEQISRLPSGQASGKIELMTLRDKVLSELSGYLAFTWTPSLSSPLEATLSTRLADGSTVNLLTGSQVNETLATDGRAVTLAGSAKNLAADSGAIGAQRQFLETELTEWENHWNLLAGEVGRVVNAVYNPDQISGENFFAADSFTAASLRLEITQSGSVRAGIGGSGKEIAEAVGALASTDLNATFGSPIAGTFGDDLLDRQSSLARQIARERTAAGAQEKVVTFLEQEKSNRSGVDLDAEVTQLIQFQRSFQATSRVLRALDESLESFLADIA